MHHHTDDHPTRNEEEYFVRENAELIKQMRAVLDSERRVVQMREHYMKCPKCGRDLEERQFENVKVDVCTDCHGVWIDRGEIRLLRHIQQSQGPFSRIMSDVLEFFQHPKTGESSSSHPSR